MAETGEVSILLMPQRKKKISINKGKSYGLTKRRRTKYSWIIEAMNVEIPILIPRLPTETQEPGGNIPMEFVDP